MNITGILEIVCSGNQVIQRHHSFLNNCKCPVSLLSEQFMTIFIIHIFVCTYVFCQCSCLQRSEVNPKYCSAGDVHLLKMESLSLYPADSPMVSPMSLPILSSPALRLQAHTAVPIRCHACTANTLSTAPSHLLSLSLNQCSLPPNAVFLISSAINLILVLACSHLTNPLTDNNEEL